MTGKTMRVPISLLILVLGIIAAVLYWRFGLPDRVGPLSTSSTSFRQFTLTLPREPEVGEDLTASVFIGTLPKEAEVILRTDDGEIAGAIAPFGTIPGRKAGQQAVPIPRSAVKDGKVVLRMEVHEPGKEVRPPTASEVEGAELLLVPVTREGDTSLK